MGHGDDGREMMVEILTPARIGGRGSACGVPRQRTVASSMANLMASPQSPRVPLLSAAAPYEPRKPLDATAPTLTGATVTSQHPANQIPPVAELADSARSRARTNLRDAGSGCASNEIYRVLPYS